MHVLFHSHDVSAGIVAAGWASPMRQPQRAAIRAWDQIRRLKPPIGAALVRSAIRMSSLRQCHCSHLPSREAASGDLVIFFRYAALLGYPQADPNGCRLVPRRSRTALRPSSSHMSGRCRDNLPDRQRPSGCLIATAALPALKHPTRNETSPKPAVPPGPSSGYPAPSLPWRTLLRLSSAGDARKLPSTLHTPDEHCQGMKAVGS